MKDIVDALDRMKSAGLRVGPEWHAAHELAQGREGDPAHDWLHAFCHRIEGDDWNAGYWYRRAGKARGEGPLEEEWAVIRGAMTAGKI